MSVEQENELGASRWARGTEGPRLGAALRRLGAAALWWVAASTVAAGGSATTPVPRFDWHWLARYSVLNREAERGRADLIFIGDSIVENFGAAGQAVWTHYYAPRHALNLGIGGDRTQHVLWRLQHGNLGRLAPRLALVLIGQNNGGHNSAPEIAAGVSAIVRVLRDRLPTTRILLLAIFPRGERPSPERVDLAEASALTARLADGRHVFYLDVNRIWLGPDGSIRRTLMADFEHPTPLGYRAWAEAIEPEVAELMGDRPVAPLP